MNKLMDLSGAKMVLSAPLDDFGEFMPKLCIEMIRETVGSIITMYKENEGISGDYLWK